jgi:putative endonuclease
MSPAPSPRTCRGRTGIAAEAVARRHLESLGWTIVAANVLVGHGELDLVTLDPAAPGTLVVVEVRGARTSRFGAPEESVDARKLARLRAATFALLRSDWPMAHGVSSAHTARIDVIAVRFDTGCEAGGPQIRHLRGVTDP